MATREHVVIVGGGLAGWRAAEELRAAGFLREHDTRPQAGRAHAAAQIQVE